MNKRSLIKFLFCSYFIITGALVFAGSITVKGKVMSNGKAIPSVQITDGKSIVLTDKNGKFNLETSGESEYVYYSLPSGYESPVVNGIPVFFQKINEDTLKILKTPTPKNNWNYKTVNFKKKKVKNSGLYECSALGDSTSAGGTNMLVSLTEKLSFPFFDIVYFRSYKISLCQFCLKIRVFFCNV